jgi:hypothetical protein
MKPNTRAAHDMGTLEDILLECGVWPVGDSGPPRRRRNVDLSNWRSEMPGIFPVRRKALEGLS